MKENVRPIYEELQGYLSQAPTIKEVSYLRDRPLWEQFNRCLDELVNITKNDYTRFRLTPIPDGDSQYVLNTEYRSKLNGLIMNLHAKYFKDEQSPFSGTPGVVVSQSQQQAQSVQVAMLMEFQSTLDKRLYGSKLGKKEKSFLEKVKKALPTVKTATELVKLVITIAKSCGLEIAEVIKTLGL
ncbi:MAG TPA: hypothetical protein VMW41_00520 [Candidatus Bathyarchaeia archaeon]|nr:hypothetical protein [Candidatus Bathyarchaeia archaeon]